MDLCTHQKCNKCCTSKYCVFHVQLKQWSTTQTAQTIDSYTEQPKTVPIRQPQVFISSQGQDPLPFFNVESHFIQNKRVHRLHYHHHNKGINGSISQTQSLQIGADDEKWSVISQSDLIYIPVMLHLLLSQFSRIKDR
ncbi:MAG: hypothetical protein EZS28_051320 [Streblomastix strix]|uniref:Uncharacterized protein n=1 Tax=Streblomastix strix TaxID=222440 RepID=A0A5J4T5U4_9EUKA|nr:MAG: hypothetical protein EZS28_051320 [Streblomastix strix]